MKRIFLIKYGEIALKGENRKEFVHQLKQNMKRRLKGIKTTILHKAGRLYLHCDAEDRDKVPGALRTTFGIISFAEAIEIEKDMEKIAETALTVARGLVEAGKRFKVECRRTDKTFPLNSYGIACQIGALLLENLDNLEVNLNHPDWIVKIEIREHAYVYGKEEKGLGGLPVGCAGGGLLLLSGGIDSPVAGYLMGKRGLNIYGVYFHTHPFTSEGVLEKVKKLAQILSPYFNALRLYIVSFTDIQVKIKEEANKNEVTLHSRACMMSIADRIAESISSLCLITGESLSQVASQTAQSMRYTGSTTDLPVFRPLIGLDKEEIVNIARKIGTFETSIQPFPDCCTIFAPKRPLIKPNFNKITIALKALELDDLINKAVETAEIINF